MATADYNDLNSVKNIGTGDTVPASWFDQARDNLEHLARPAGCVVERTASVTLSNNTSTEIEFTAADLRDTDSFHDTGTNPERITIPSGLGGWYIVTAQVSFAANSSGRRFIGWRINGSGAGVQLSVSPDPTNTCVLQCTGELLLSAGQYLSVGVLQSSGGNLAVTDAHASVRKVAEST